MFASDFQTDIHRIALAMTRGLLPSLALQLVERTGSVANFFNMSESELSALLGFRNRIFSADYRRDILAKAEREAEYIHANNIVPLFYGDDDYPRALAECDDAPLLLYTLGGRAIGPATRMLSIVGTRHATPYGVDFVNRLVADIAAMCGNDICIVSGLAFGIDIAAHRAAIAAELPTIAVVAHGLNTIYPAQHRSDAVRIIDTGGMLMSEYTSTDAIHKGNFLARNRIVAGLSEALLVAESGEKGGAMVTARLAGAYSREVFALPGRISDRWSRGCNRMIAANAATLVESADDLIDALRWPRTAAACAASAEPTLPLLSPEEQRMADYLTTHPDSHLNDLAVELDISPGRLNALLLELEFRNIVIRKPGGRFSLA